MGIPKVMDVAALLLEHHLEYQKQLGNYITMKQFAVHIGINDKEYNMIFHKKRKFTKEMAKKFADFFDDLRFYDAAGEPRPNEITYRLDREWDAMPEKYRKQVKDAVEKYMTEKNNERG